MRRFIWVATLTMMATFLGSIRATAETAVPITRISFAGAGGNFTQRYGIFVVPDQDTSLSAYGGALSRYDVHIAKMIEITHFEWCEPRPNYQGVYYSYEANNGKVFMGQLYISCAMAQNAVKTFGLGRPESTVIYDRDRSSTVSIPVLDLNGRKIPEFKRLVQSIRPQCIDKLCPGDRIP
ncbi:MAG: hypothetical protein WBG73_18615 [Coleofasciculaceae cyanobacterium]